MLKWFTVSPIRMLIMVARDAAVQLLFYRRAKCRIDGALTKYITYLSISSHAQRSVIAWIWACCSASDKIFRLRTHRHHSGLLEGKLMRSV